MDPEMPVENERKRMPLQESYSFLDANGLTAEAAKVRDTHLAKDLFSQRVRRGMLVEILRAHNLFDKFVSEQWPFGATDAGKRKIEKYEQCYEEWLDGKENATDEDSDEDAGRFAVESDLRDYLAKNLGLVEPGMALWPVASGESAVEFRVAGGRRIDILAKDRNGVPVVIELKVSRGHEKVIGQALYYRACIREKFGVPQVRAVIVACEIGPELRLATKELVDVLLFEYQLSMTLTKV